VSSVSVEFEFREGLFLRRIRSSLPLFEICIS
jgi:hypothetical protein